MDQKTASAGAIGGSGWMHFKSDFCGWIVFLSEFLIGSRPHFHVQVITVFFTAKLFPPEARRLIVIARRPSRPEFLIVSRPHFHIQVITPQYGIVEDVGDRIEPLKFIAVIKIKNERLIHFSAEYGSCYKVVQADGNNR